LPAVARHVSGIDVAQQQGMALFWETTPAPKPTAKAAPLSPLAIALLLKLQSEAEKLAA
jgi:hypothetical protein